MKKQTYLIIAAIMLATVAGLSTAHAQTSSKLNLTANIPFDFYVGDKAMPAGEYTVICVNPTSPVKVLQIRSKSGTTSAIVRTNSVNGLNQDNGRLLFNRYGDQYFFAQAWMAADGIGMQAPPSRAMKELELARAKHTTEALLASAR